MAGRQADIKRKYKCVMCGFIADSREEPCQTCGGEAFTLVPFDAKCRHCGCEYYSNDAGSTCPSCGNQLHEPPPVPHRTAIPTAETPRRQVPRAPVRLVPHRTAIPTAETQRRDRRWLIVAASLASLVALCWIFRAAHRPQPRNDAEAKLRQAAAQGNADAQFLVGLMYGKAGALSATPKWRSSGGVGPPSKGMSGHRSNLACCTRRGAVFRRVTKRRRSGIARPPNKGSPRFSSGLA